MNGYIRICAFSVVPIDCSLGDCLPDVHIIDLSGERHYMYKTPTYFNLKKGTLHLSSGIKYVVISYAEYQAILLINPLFNEASKRWLISQNSKGYRNTKYTAYVVFPKE